ncbi:lipopolysaccharide biosynthesis protein [Vibrio sp. F13]|uniref:lipopolysaccharide biosynthesis protein n=1 Tax=Vibrio sp. F13 TaxID=2070777 RepID=UPI0010BDA0CB|nr:lipopolysaccharide biosynthesis protein [Vibrio sp. F13]TKF99448.1 lipopolysaccharide biosynthesis protein [Vibrio sp. F13]
MSLKNKAISGMLWTFGEKVFSQVVSFAVIIVLARELSPSDFGLIGMLTIFLVIAESLINSGFSQALIQKHDRTEVDYSTVFYINMVFSVILYFILFISAPLIADFYSAPELVDISRVVFLSLVINALCLVPDTRLSIQLDFKTKSKINVISLVISSSVSIYLALNGFGVWTIVYQNILRILVKLLLLIVICKWKPLFSFSIESFKQLFGFGSKLLFAGLVATFVNNLYSLLIGRYFGMKDVGYYTQGERITNVFSSTISVVLQGVTYPIMTSVQHDTKRLVSIYNRLVGMTAFCVFPVMVGLAMIAEPFVLLFFTEKWLPSVPIIQSLCLAAAFVPINVIHLNILNATGRSDLFLKVDLSKLPVNLIILVFTIPYGIEMVAQGQILSRALGFILNSYYPGKLYQYGLIAQLKDLIPVIIPTIIMALTIWCINVNEPIYNLIFSIVVAVPVYILSSYVIKSPPLAEVITILRNNKSKFS